MKPPRFGPEEEARFRQARLQALAEINVQTFWLVAALVLRALMKARDRAAS